MLEECAPGSSVRLATHSRVIQYNNLVYRKFPKHDPVEIGHIRKLVRYLGIPRDCVKKHISGLFGPSAA